MAFVRCDNSTLDRESTHEQLEEKTRIQLRLTDHHHPCGRRVEHIPLCEARACGRRHPCQQLQEHHRRGEYEGVARANRLGDDVLRRLTPRQSASTVCGKREEICRRVAGGRVQHHRTRRRLDHWRHQCPVFVIQTANRAVPELTEAIRCRTVQYLFRAARAQLSRVEG